MAHLPRETITLTGGCYCRAVRYTVRIPPWDDRPAVPGALDTPISAQEKVPTKVPVIDLDHCDTCRRASGTLVQCWFICPVAWVEWDLADRNAPDQTMHLSTDDAVGPVDADCAPPSTYVSRFSCTDRATRTFCGRCGTNLTYVSHKRVGTALAVVDVTVGSLDADSITLVRPDRHGWWDHGVGWIKSLLRHGDGGFMIRHQTGDTARAVEN